MRLLPDTDFVLLVTRLQQTKYGPEYVTKVNIRPVVSHSRSRESELESVPYTLSDAWSEDLIVDNKRKVLEQTRLKPKAGTIGSEN